MAENRLIPLTQWPYAWPTKDALRKYVDRAADNFATMWIVRRGNRVLIDEASFWRWVAARDDAALRHAEWDALWHLAQSTPGGIEAFQDRVRDQVAATKARDAADPAAAAARKASVEVLFHDGEQVEQAKAKAKARRIKAKSEGK